MYKRVNKAQRDNQPYHFTEEGLKPCIFFVCVWVCFLFQNNTSGIGRQLKDPQHLVLHQVLLAKCK